MTPEERLGELGLTLPAPPPPIGTYVGAVHTGAHWTQVHVPASAAHVVSVADLITKLRAFAADLAFPGHGSTSAWGTKANCTMVPNPPMKLKEEEQEARDEYDPRHMAE